MQVRADAQRGHITLTREGEGQAVVTFVDLGPVLQVWQYDGGVEIDPADARALGASLVAWADRKELRDPGHCDDAGATIRLAAAEWCHGEATSDQAMSAVLGAVGCQSCASGAPS